MDKFTFSFDGDDSAVNMEFFSHEDRTPLNEVVAKFEQFLKGCGIEIDGKLKIVNEKNGALIFENIVLDHEQYLNNFDPMRYSNIDDSPIEIKLDNWQFDFSPENYDAIGAVGAGGGSTCENCVCGKKNAN